jgi:hypothetical protein
MTVSIVELMLSLLITTQNRSYNYILIVNCSNMTEEDIKNLSADLVNYENGWFTIDILYKGKPIKRISK